MLTRPTGRLTGAETFDTRWMNQEMAVGVSLRMTFGPDLEIISEPAPKFCAGRTLGSPMVGLSYRSYCAGPVTGLVTNFSVISSIFTALLMFSPKSWPLVISPVG